MTSPLVGGGLRRSAVAWCAIVAAGVHAATYHPNYLCYSNAPRHEPYLDISDSNVDWGQGLKQARAWLDAHPHDGRPVWLRHFGIEGIRYDLGDRVVALGDDDPSPTRGLLIISPVYVAGPHGPPGAYTALQRFEPDAVIGHGLLVYDLDRLGGGSPFRWPGGSSPTASRDREAGARAAGCRANTSFPHSLGGSPANRPPSQALPFLSAR